MQIFQDDTFALVVDIQEKLMPHIYKNEALLNKMLKLINGLRELEVELVLNEQYPKGIGKTIPEIKNLLPEINAFEKTTFSCCNDESLSNLQAKNKQNVIVFGIETHVCVLQTCLSLIEAKLTPILVVDCCGSRKEIDHEIAIKRLYQSGAILTTYESLLFELLKDSKNEAFKAVSKIIK